MMTYFSKFSLKHTARVLVSILMIWGVLFSVMPVETVLAASYTDTFSTEPFSSPPYPTNFTTGTPTVGLSYVCNNCNFDWDGSTIQSVSIIHPGTVSSITITARNGHAFSFTSIGFEPTTSLQITGTGTNGFDFTTPASNGTYGPGTSNLVNQVVISTIGTTYPNIDVYFDNVSVSFDPLALTSFTRQTPSTTPTNVDSLVFRATFSEGVQNVSTDDFTVNGTTTATVTNVSSVSTTVYDITVSGGDLASFNGVVGMNLSGSQNISSTADGSPLPAAEPSTDQTYTLDNTGPTVSINQAVGQSDPATSGPINFTVVFGESVTDFATGDVTLSGTAGATTATVTGSGTTYNVAVSGMNVDGTVIASIPAAAASDALGNPSSASSGGDNQVTFNGNPEIDIQRPSGTSITDGGSDAIGNRSILSTVHLTYTVDNSAGTDTLSISNVTASGLSNVSNFSLDTATPINVAGGAASSFDVSFDVDVNGAFSFSMDIANNDSTENPYNVTISGTGTGGVPEMDLQRPAGTSIADNDTDALGNRIVGTVNLTYTVDNTAGTEQLSITNVTASNESNVSGFSLDTATPINIAAGTTGTFDVSFDVNINGAFSFDMDIANTDGDENPYTITVSGTGTGGVPEIDIQRPASTSIIDGGSDPIGSHALHTVNLTYTVDNSTGGDTLTISNVTASSLSNVSNFSLDTTTPITVAAGTTSSFDISFDIDVNGAFSFAMAIANDDSDENPYNITVSGIGTGGVPEIDMQRPASTSIADGDTDTVGNQAVGTVNLTYTVDNSAGTGALTISGVTASSLSNVSGFSLITATPITIAPGATSTFNVSFTVGVNGAFSFDMAIANDDSSENPYNIAVSGTGTGGAPEIDIQRPAATSISDGGTDALLSQPVGTVNLTYTVDNTAGTDTLTISSVTASSLSNVSGFTLGTATPITVAAGATSTFAVSFTVGVNGAFSFDMAIANDDSSENPYNIAVSGTGTGGVPEINMQRPSGTSILDGNTDNLSDQPIGTVNLTYTIDNTAGTGALTISDVSASNYTNASTFSLGTSVPIVVAPGSTGTFDISFSVPVNGTFSFDMAIANDDSDENPYTITISGTGTGGTPEIDIQRPAATSIPDGNTDALGSQPAGVVNLTYTVDNSAGTSALNISNVTAANLINASGFSMNTGTPINVAAGATSTFNVSFTVSGAGAFSLDMDISNNDSSESNYDIAISGTGYLVPEIAVSYAGVAITDGDNTPIATDGTDFGDDLINVLTYSPEHTFTITNTGLGTLNLGGSPRVTLTGIDFSLITDAPASINPGASATFTVRFAATAAVIHSGTISIANDDSDENPFNFIISGTGYSGSLLIMQGGSPQQDIPDGDTTPGIADDTDFGAVSVDSGTVDHIFELNNFGDSTLVLSGTPLVEISGLHAADFTVTDQPATPIASGGTDTFTIQFNPSAAGNRTATVSISNNDPSRNPYTFTIQGQGDDFTVVMGGNTSPLDGVTLSSAPTQLLVQFNRSAISGGGTNAADFTGNYLLVEDGVNNTFDTSTCLAGIAADDTSVAITAASYNDSTFTATLSVASASFVAGGRYRLFVCGTTSVEDSFGNELNGGTEDTQINFSIAAVVSAGTATILPATGFPVGILTNLPQQPQSMAYSTSEMILEIPALGERLPIIGVPLVDGIWDVSWLGGNAGYLAGTAYPTWKGNTVITGHVWDALNQPGPFAELKTLKYGDLLKIYSGNSVYTYEIRDTRLYSPTNLNAVIKHEKLDWVTLVTCEGYQESNETYTSRRVVRAVLIKVEAQ
jgi:LPXTG-site transpeptidase (sortase) family protein